jgi:Domain of unknown function (DUF4270)
MNKKSIFKTILVGFIVIITIVSCDKEFNEIGSEIVGDDHYIFEKYTGATVMAYNQKLGPISSNNLLTNPLGFYTNPAFGTTQANFVTQVEMASSNPTFNNVDPDDYDENPTVLDSVILEVPYFSNVISTEVREGITYTEYELESIYGEEPYDETTNLVNSKFKLSVYQSNYYLRNLDPSESLAQQQLYYTNQNNDIDNNKIPVLLNNLSTSDPLNTDGHENSQFYFDKREHKTIIPNADEEQPDVEVRSAPSMRLHLSKDVFDAAIINAPSGQLANNEVFKNYFRGIYFKTESTGNPGNMAMLNFKAGKITLYYNEDLKKTISGDVTYERVNKTFVLNLNGNTISLLDNYNENLDYLNATINNNQEASKLYLKGGQGSIAAIDLFGQADNYRFVVKTENGNIIKDEDGDPLYVKEYVSNNVSDELDDLRYPQVSGSTTDYSTKNRWMINQASITFYIDKVAMSNSSTVEPLRIYLYDLTNNKVIADYSSDNTNFPSNPSYNKPTYGGIIEKVDGKGVKYTFRVTNHIRNLINTESTNVRLGLSVTENINNSAFSKLKTSNTTTDAAPSMSVMSPVGTILHGSNPAVIDDERLKLEILYTKPD